MEIRVTSTDREVELAVSGRLDAYWSEHLASEVDRVVRTGQRVVALDLSETSFLSSAGISALIKAHRALQTIGGRLEVRRPSDVVRRILELSRLTALLHVDHPAQTVPLAQPVGAALELHGMRLQVFSDLQAGDLAAALVGSPRALHAGGFAEQDCVVVKFPASTMGLGLGALGHSFGECQGWFGEFLAAGGAVATLPTQGTLTPDYVLAAEALVPEVEACYGITATGAFARRVHFEAGPPDGVVTLTELARTALTVAEAPRVGMVLIGEASSLMGVALRRSPIAGKVPSDLFGLPQARDWLLFTAERAFTHSVVLIVGFVARDGGGLLAPLLRPLGRDGDLAAHFHAAAFSYRPLPRTPVDLADSVRALFTGHTLDGVLHLVADDREIAGAGESELVRGSFWAGPLVLGGKA